jgi:hypothetical protein
MGFLKNHLSGEDTPQARRPGALAREAQQARTPGPHRRLPARASAGDRAAHTAQASPEPLSRARLGAPAVVSQSVSQRFDAAASRLGTACRLVE